LVASANEVVKAFKADSAEIKVSRHPAGDGSGLTNVDVVTAPDRLVGCGETHGTSSDYDQSRHF
jgi:hypothetical protein